jgi:hypothetical protein
VSPQSHPSGVQHSRKLVGNDLDRSTTALGSCLDWRTLQADVHTDASRSARASSKPSTMSFAVRIFSRSA